MDGGGHPKPNRLVLCVFFSRLFWLALSRFQSKRICEICLYSSHKNNSTARLLSFFFVFNSRYSVRLAVIDFESAKCTRKRKKVFGLYLETACFFYVYYVLKKKNFQQRLYAYISRRSVCALKNWDSLENKRNTFSLTSPAAKLWEKRGPLSHPIFLRLFSLSFFKSSLRGKFQSEIVEEMELFRLERSPRKEEAPLTVAMYSMFHN